MPTRFATRQLLRVDAVFVDLDGVTAVTFFLVGARLPTCARYRPVPLTALHLFRTQTVEKIYQCMDSDLVLLCTWFVANRTKPMATA